MNQAAFPTSSEEAKRVDLRAPHLALGEVVERFGEEDTRELFRAFQRFNAEFFGGRLAAPMVLKLSTGNPRTLGDYCPRDEHGLESRIRIAPHVMRRGWLYVLDVLLHEMVHAWQWEIDRDLELTYRGHGRKFAAECNRIGALLGLPPVGVPKLKSGKHLPACNYWPSCVRPEGYYPEPWTSPTRKPNEPDENDAEQANGKDVARILSALLPLDSGTLRKIVDVLEDEIAARE